MKLCVQLLAALGCVVLFAGCAGDVPISLQATIPHTRAVEQRAITLTTFFEFNPSHVSPRYHLPAGRYMAAYEDQSGVYFSAPSKIIEKRIVGTFELEGGLYLPKGPQPRLRVYCALNPGSGGPWQKFDLPPAFLAAEGRFFFIQPPLPHSSNT